MLNGLCVLFGDLSIPSGLYRRMRLTAFTPHLGPPGNTVLIPFTHVTIDAFGNFFCVQKCIQQTPEEFVSIFCDTALYTFLRLLFQRWQLECQPLPACRSGGISIETSGDSEGISIGTSGYI